MRCVNLIFALFSLPVPLVHSRHEFSIDIVECKNLGISLADSLQVYSSSPFTQQTINPSVDPKINHLYHTLSTSTKSLVFSNRNATTLDILRLSFTCV